MSITKESVQAATKRGQDRLAKIPAAHSVRFDTKRCLVVIALSNGCEFAFPPSLAEGLAGAPKTKLSKIEISASGLGLHWPLLDADLYVPSLIEGHFGSRQWMQQIGKKGGTVRSVAKAKAARANGQKGGRPRVQSVV
jgi:hypothetical protein